jgi:N-acetylmuramoyl-L-alanine amidase
MKKVYEQPTVTIARFDVEEWLTQPISGCSIPINPGHGGDQPGHGPCPQIPKN